MIVFVGSNPSHLGPDSPAMRNLKAWWRVMGLIHPKFVNVSSEPTPGNRPLKKSEYQLFRLRRHLKGCTRVIALGATASDALTRIAVPHFRLPHPSPRNRQLNDAQYVLALLGACRTYIEGDLHVDRNGRRDARSF